MKKTTEYRSDFLFSDSDFIIGMGSALNIAGNYFEFATSKNENEADSKAILNDWGCVGQDLKNALTAALRRDKSINREESVCE